MQYIKKDKALILLADGTIFYGKSIGKKGSAFGEVCFKQQVTKKFLPTLRILAN